MYPILDWYLSYYPFSMYSFEADIYHVSSRDWCLSYYPFLMYPVEADIYHTIRF